MLYRLVRATNFISQMPVTNTSRGVSNVLLAISLLALLPVAWFGARELFWRMEAGILKSQQSPDGGLLAELRYMPEGSEVPYGKGVFIRHKGALLLHYQSELAFAAYCREADIQWLAHDQLHVVCLLAEGKPYVPAESIRGVKVSIQLLPVQ